MAWSQKAKLDARKIETGSINIEGLKSVLPTIRSMSTTAPEKFCPELLRLLKELGIALIFLPHIKGSFRHGAIFYDGKKIVLGLNVRGRYADKFWFSLLKRTLIHSQETRSFQTKF